MLLIIATISNSVRVNPAVEAAEGLRRRFNQPLMRAANQSPIPVLAIVATLSRCSPNVFAQCSLNVRLMIRLDVYRCLPNVA
jgi:hypothetical protein